jgi:Sugar-transfer associated ATP-grasp
MARLRELRQFGTALVRSLGDPRRKGAAQMIKEMGVFAFHNGFDPRRYIHSRLFIRNREDYLLYLSGPKYWHLRRLVTAEHVAPVLKNKLLFQVFFVGKGLPLPQYIGHTDSGVFVGANGEVAPLASAAAFRALIEPLLERHDGSMFAKPLTLYGGTGAVRITAESEWRMLFEAVTQENYIFQEEVKQHAEIRRVYPLSLNTLRVTTCVPADRNPAIACARMRFGRGGSHIDNGSAGGFFAGVDLETGRLCTDGLTAMQRSGDVFAVHPDTKVPIKGFRLPDFPAAKNLVRRAAEALPYPLVG